MDIDGKAASPKCPASAGQNITHVTLTSHKPVALVISCVVQMLALLNF